MENWEFKDKDKMIDLLVGSDFSEDGNTDFHKINEAKLKVAIDLYKDMNVPDSKNAIIVDLGSGLGLVAKHLAPNYKKIICVDISESFLDEAQKICASIANIEFNKMDFAKLSFLPDQSVDAVYSYNMFIHLNLFDMAQYFKEINRVLKPNGTLWFDFANAREFRKGVPELFRKMSRLYFEGGRKPEQLVQWHDPAAIIALAKDNNFNLVFDNSTSELSNIFYRIIFFLVQDRLYNHRSFFHFRKKILL